MSEELYLFSYDFMNTVLLAFIATILAMMYLERR